MNKLFSKSEIYKTYFCGREPSEWCGMDKPQFQCKDFDESISYNFNEYGYRCDNFNTFENYNVITLGDSASFGIGIPYETTYTKILCELLQKDVGAVSNYNLSMQGIGNDVLSRLVLSTVPLLNPSMVLVHFTYIGRREYVDINGTTHDISPSDYYGSTIEYETAKKGHDLLVSDYEDGINFLKNYKLIEMTLNNMNIPWYFTIQQDMDIIEQYSDWLDIDHFIDDVLVQDNKARDQSHTGIDENIKYGEILYNKIKRRT